MQTDLHNRIISVSTFILLSLFMPLNFSWALTYGAATEIPNPVKSKGIYISNPDGILMDRQVEILQAMVSQHEKKTGNEIAIVVIEKIENLTPKEMAHQLFNLWGVGKAKSDNGLLILVSKLDRRVEFETGYGLEGDLPDVVCKRIQMQKMVPFFKEGNYFGALETGVKAVVSILEKSEISNGDSEGLPSVDEPAVESNSKGSDEIHPIVMILITLSILLSLVLGFSTRAFARSASALWVVVFIYIFSLFAGLLGPPLNFSASLAVYLVLGVNAFVFLLGCLLIYNVRKSSGQKNRNPVINQLVANGWGAPAAIFFPLGWSLYWLFLRSVVEKLRTAPITCSRCNSRCDFVPQSEENAFLHVLEGREEKLGSVSYDVWKCPSCPGVETVVIPSFLSEFKTCEKCHRQGFHRVNYEIKEYPTYTEYGRAVETFRCEICKTETEKIIKLDKHTVNNSNSSSGGSSFGGGFSGGSSFGGGSSGGGGAGSSW